ncbi:hypothetical protein Pan44_25200 [Caulifigura coniformis]|uniref:Glycosyltransferase RgtA/B/C/D-like domain-containing protein n=1 Tax=Caulifigura coniformis TaxID=2527983 RepID=A0A517SEF8_9PLAN|nr:hypothetical protein [Caulifigura coniformis]QDT54487.1 hypothetical protein Pan44_25200 [Caulifigura coniformis]
MNAPSRQSGGLLLIVLVAIVARVAACLAFPANLSDDRDVYLAMATGIREGRGLSSPGTTIPTAFRPPLYPLLLVPVSDSPFGRAALHCGIAAGMVLAVYWLAGLSTLSPGRKLFAALVVAVDPLLVYYSTLPMTETLAAAGSALLLAAAAAACKSASVHRRTVYCAMGAVAFGVCVMTRPTYWAFTACVVAFGLWQVIRGTRDPGKHEPRTRDWVLGGLLTVAIVAPWVIRNGKVMGRPILTTTHGGYTLLLGNNDAYYDEVVRQPLGTVWDGSHGPGQQAWVAHLADQMREAGVEGEIATDQWMKDRAWETIRARPGTFLEACIRRFLSFWAVRPHAESASAAGRALSLFSAVWYSALWVALTLGVWNAIRTGGCAVELSLLLIVAFVLVHLVYWTDARMRAPIMPAIAILAAGAGFKRSANFARKSD